MARKGRRSWGARGSGLLLAFALTACDGLLKSDKLPSGVTDPTISETPQGALAAYNGTVVQFRDAFASDQGEFGDYDAFIQVTGLLSDELVVNSTSLTPAEDLRVMPEGDDPSNSIGYSKAFAQLQRTRGQAGQALGLLADYLPERPALAAHVYALEGYAEVFLAELYCSGIPLSTLDYRGDYTVHPGSTTEAVFTHAIALFDSALALAGDSVNFQRLAQVGKARALLALGQYTAAAAVVGGIPDNYVYAFSFDTATAKNFAYARPSILSSGTIWSWNLSVGDPEGANGLDYGTSGDPRTTVTNINPGSTTWHPDKYSVDGSSPIVLASGVEARLIEAEAALQAGSGAWLTSLNALRTDGTFDTTETTPPDTLWHAGTGGVAGLAPLQDPGTADGRVDLLFRERAFWLFLTGHRQGDLRRLIRQYGRLQSEVYPVGVTSSGLIYGDDVTEPVPNRERLSNPLFQGCFSREA